MGGSEHAMYFFNQFRLKCGHVFVRVVECNYLHRSIALFSLFCCKCGGLLSWRMPLDVWRVAAVGTTCIFVRVLRMFGWWWRLWRAMVFPTSCWHHFVESHTDKNFSWSGWQGYAADASSTHHPCRTCRMWSLDSLMSSVSTSMIKLSWLLMGGTIPTCKFCGSESACVWSWGCVRCGGFYAGESSAFCCGFVVCWCAEASTNEFETCFVVPGVLYPSLNKALLALSLGIFVERKPSQQLSKMERYHTEKQERKEKNNTKQKKTM